MSDLSKETRKSGIKIVATAVFSFLLVFVLIAIIDANMNLQRVLSVWSLATILVFETEELIKISSLDRKKQGKILNVIKMVFDDSFIYFAYIGISVLLSILLNRVLVQKLPVFADEKLPAIVTGLSLIVYFLFNMKIRMKKIDLEESGQK